MNASIRVEKEQIADFCQRHSIVKMALFGSVMRDDFARAPSNDDNLAT